MKKHSRIEYEENEREMLDLFRKLNWREQVLLIGRMEVMTENARRDTVIQFPPVSEKNVHKGCMV